MAELDPELAALRDGVSETTPMVNLAPGAVRERVVAGNRLCGDGPDVHVRDRARGEDGAPVALRTYQPATASHCTLVYAHGGGWVTGDLDYADEFCRYLAAEAGVRVVSVDYRLAPEYPYPAALEDLAAAWAWVADRYDGSLALGGDSAGGNLAAVLAHRSRAAEHHPSFVLLLYPVLGLPDETPSYRSNATAFPTGAAEMRWFFDHYATRDVLRAAPIDLVPLRAVDLAGVAPTHLVLAEHDPLHDEGAAYAARLDGAGVPVTVSAHPDLCHGFLRFTGASAAARSARSAAVAAVAHLATATKVPQT